LKRGTKHRFSKKKKLPKKNATDINSSNRNDQWEFGLKDIYSRMGECLGFGAFAQTYLMQERSSHELAAVKIFPIPKFQRRSASCIEREIEIQANLCEENLNVVRVFELILTNSNLALALEYMTKGTLSSYLDKIMDSRTSDCQKSLIFTEKIARYFFRQIISAIEFCHVQKVMHRDIKLDNILLDSSWPPRIKVCDFGFAKSWNFNKDSNSRSIIGTPVYMAPEVLTAGASHKDYDGRFADIWSAGILLFVMLFGGYPFDESPNRFKHVPRNRFAAHMEVYLQQSTGSWSDCAGDPDVLELIELISPECKNILNQILNMDPENRIRMIELKQHHWLSRKNVFQKNKNLSTGNKHHKGQLNLNELRENRRRSYIIKFLIETARLTREKYIG
jgi:serine/threonine-protein kinase SRK2